MKAILVKISLVFICLIVVACTAKTEKNEPKKNDIQTQPSIKDEKTSSDLENIKNQNTEESLTEQSQEKEILAPTQNIEQVKWTITEDSEWYDLYNRLKEDGIYGDDIDSYFMQLEGQFSQKPMGIKIRELYNNSFRKRTPSKTPPVKDTSPNTTGVPRPWYKDYVTEANAQKCRDFINENKEAFARVEEKYKISAELVSALIYVETKHGDYLGEHSPLINLASMSNSTRFEQIPNYTTKLPRAQEKKQWILTKMKEKSDWSYKELEALLLYCRANDINPVTLPSSIYGALGFGQFMPTNIPHYAVDGNDDGIINLFTPADGIISVANFLYKHGLNTANPTMAQKLKVLKRYNYSSTYANTIMALSVLTDRTK